MTDAHSPQNPEAQLESLLRALLDEEPGDGAARPSYAPPAILELVETARLMRAVTQWVPLPEGRAAVRRALLTTATEHLSRARASAWRPGGRGLIGVGAAAAATLILAFGLGAGALDGFGLPGSGLYDARLQVDAIRVALMPSPVSKAELLVRAAHLRIAEIDEMVASGDTRGMAQAAAALDQEATWLRAITATLSPVDRRRLEDAIAR